MKSVKLIANYVNRPGLHCISSAIRDIFEFYGYRFTEELIFGLDSSLGFQIIEDEFEPLFLLGGKRTTFDGSICNILGIGLEKKVSIEDQGAWSEFKSYIDLNVPVLVQVDMYYLDYFIRSPGHFGGHMIVLVGYDLTAKVFFVAERQDEYLNEKLRTPFFPLSYNSLEKACNSRCSYGFSPERKYYVFDFGKNIDIKRSIKLSIEKNAQSYLNSMDNKFGILGLKNFMPFFLKWIGDAYNKNLSIEEITKLIKKQMYLISSYIERNGTGGGLFRKIYADFLGEINSSYFTDSIFIECQDLFNRSAQIWKDISNELDLMIPKINVQMNKDEIIDLLRQRLDDKFLLLYHLEYESFYKLKNWVQKN